MKKVKTRISGETRKTYLPGACHYASWRGDICDQLNRQLLGLRWLNHHSLQWGRGDLRILVRARSDLACRRFHQCSRMLRRLHATLPNALDHCVATREYDESVGEAQHRICDAGNKPRQVYMMDADCRNADCRDAAGVGALKIACAADPFAMGRVLTAIASAKSA